MLPDDVHRRPLRERAGSPARLHAAARVAGSSYEGSSETDHYPLLPDYAMARRLSRTSEIEAPNVPVHQPPDRQDDKDQPEYAANPDGAALTVIATAVESKPAAKEKHEQQDDQNKFHWSVFHQVCRQSVPSGGWPLSTRPIEPAVERGRALEV
jgi:hypothetical protein